MAKAAKYVCIKACFYHSRRWEPGETLVPQSGEVPPSHFKVAVEGEEVVKQEKPIVTFSQMQDEESENEKKRAAELEKTTQKRFSKGKGKG